MDSLSQRRLVFCTQFKTTATSLSKAYAKQQEVAGRVVTAIRTHFGQRWSNFGELEFRVMTPAFNQLVKQTASRASTFEGLEVKQPETCPDECAKGCKWGKVVFGYQQHGLKNINKLQDDATKNPHKLYVLVYDECDYAISDPSKKKGKKNTSALGEENKARESTGEFSGIRGRMMTIDRKHLLKAPNVVFLMISATP
eukprot:gb/GEZN01008671.1/.p1 GENE.gb/GEZN01008671.1/~~gb/GEZN01008671.1/.p1  ORF type:complete len:229 (-),score=42.69 gb/GEZN01008671.1/:716-1309(-)